MVQNKLIEIINDSNDEAYQTNFPANKEKEGIYLRNARSCSGNRSQYNQSSKINQNAFKTPVDLCTSYHIQFGGNSKPPLSGSNYGNNQSTVKEMEPKKWKINRIRNNYSKNLKQSQPQRTRKEEQSKIACQKQQNLQNKHPNIRSTDSKIQNLIGDRSENLKMKSITNNTVCEDLCMIEENFDDISIDEDVPATCTVVPAKQSSFIDYKKETSSANNKTHTTHMEKTSHLTMRCEQRSNLNKSSNCSVYNSKVQPLKRNVVDQKQNEGKQSTSTGNNKICNYRRFSKSPIDKYVHVSKKNSNNKSQIGEAVCKPKFKKISSENVCSMKTKGNNHEDFKSKPKNNLSSTVSQEINADNEEVKEEPYSSSLKPKIMELKKFYSYKTNLK